MKDVADLPLVREGQQSLFGDPPLRVDLDQWHTPTWIAERMAAWIRPTDTVIEPSAGGGALIKPLLARGHDPRRITACELDPAWCVGLRDLRVEVLNGDYLLQRFGHDYFSVCLTNPPYGEALHAAFVAHALTHCRRVVALVPSAIEFGVDRCAELWMKARVVRRARLPARPRFGGDGAGKMDIVCLEIVRRGVPRAADEVNHVAEEVWL